MTSSGIKSISINCQKQAVLLLSFFAGCTRATPPPSGSPWYCTASTNKPIVARVGFYNSAIYNKNNTTRQHIFVDDGVDDVVAALTKGSRFSWRPPPSPHVGEGKTAESSACGCRLAVTGGRSSPLLLSSSPLLLKLLLSCQRRSKEPE